jgi:transcriptional regulator with XRE-family HTH domain
MSTAAELLRQARTRARLSQRALARRAGTAQSVIARIERGLTSPTWATLERLLAAAGTHSSPASDLLADVSHMLSLTPEQRLAGVRNLSAFFAAARRIDSAAGKRVSEGPVSIPIDPERIFRTLARHKVRFVLIGALAAGLQGFPRASHDADITPAPDPENLQRLAAALRDLEARIFTAQIPEGLPFDCSAAMLARGEIWNLITAAGRLDIAFRPSGTTGYDDLAQQAIHLTVFGDTLLAARLEDIIRMKEAADRPKDRQDVEVMREMLKRR